jgi:hypothetical protein
MSHSSEFDYHAYYTEHIVPSLAASASFLGNCDHPKDFYCSLQREGQLPNHAYISTTTKQEIAFLVFGEIAGFHRGTKLGAQGNHYGGKVEESVRVFLLDFVFHVNSNLFTYIGSEATTFKRQVDCKRHIETC